MRDIPECSFQEPGVEKIGLANVGQQNPNVQRVVIQASILQTTHQNINFITHDV